MNNLMTVCLYWTDSRISKLRQNQSNTVDRMMFVLDSVSADLV